MPDGTRPDQPAGDKNSEDRESLTAMQQLSPLLGAGAQLAAAVVLMFFAGKWLDDRWGTTPWMMLVGVMFGTAAGFYQFFKSVKEAEERSGSRKGRNTGSL